MTIQAASGRQLSLRRQLMREGTVVMISRIGSGLAALSVVALVARILPIESVGFYFVAYSIVSVLGVGLTFGLNHRGLRLVVQAHHQEQAGAVGQVVRQTLTAAAFASAATLTVGVIGAAALEATILPSSFGLIELVIVLVWGASIAFRFVLTSILRALGRVIVANACAFLADSVLTVTLLAMYLLLDLPGRLEFVLGISAFAGLAATAFALGLLRRFLREPIWTRRLERPGGVLRECLPIVASQLLSIAVLPSSLWVVAGLGSATEAALYGASTRVSQQLGMINTVSNIIGAPHVVALNARGETKRLALMSQALSLISSLPPLALLGALLLFGREFMGLVFGPVFTTSAEPLIILTVGRILQIGCGNGRTLLLMTGHQRALASIDGLTVLAVLLGSSAGYGLAGINGAAVGVAASVGVSAIATAALVRRRLDFWPIGVASARDLMRRIGPAQRMR